MKRIISIILSVILLFGLTACNNSDSNKEKNERVYTAETVPRMNDPFNSLPEYLPLLIEGSYEDEKIHINDFEFNDMFTKKNGNVYETYVCNIIEDKLLISVSYDLGYIKEVRLIYNGAGNDLEVIAKADALQKALYEIFLKKENINNITKETLISTQIGKIKQNFDKDKLNSGYGASQGSEYLIKSKNVIINKAYYYKDKNDSFKLGIIIENRNNNN